MFTECSPQRSLRTPAAAAVLEHVGLLLRGGDLEREEDSTHLYSSHVTVRMGSDESRVECRVRDGRGDL